MKSWHLIFSSPAGIVIFVVLVTLMSSCGGIDAAREAGEKAAGRGGSKADSGEKKPEPPSQAPESSPSESEDTAGPDVGSSGEATAGAAEATMGTTVAEAGRALEDKYYEDADGNAIPDFIEAENGGDPKVDDCARKGGCGSVSDDVGSSSLADEQNTLLILDSSRSMAEQDSSGLAKIAGAKDALERFVVGTPDSFNLGLMVYGHEGSNSRADRAESCRGIDTFAPLGELEVGSVRQTLGQFQPTGWTPVAGSLEAAAGEFAGEEGAVNRVILVTDGIETCGGDPVAAARALKESGIAVTVDVVGFDVASAAEQEALRQVAEATGGEYADAQSAAELNDYFDDQVARTFEVVGALTCLQFQATDATTCVNFSSSAAVTDLNYELADEPADSGRREAIEGLQDRIEANAEAYKRQIEEATGPRIEELERELDEVQKRYTERYDGEVSWSDPCPEPSVVFASERRTASGSPGRGDEG